MIRQFTAEMQMTNKQMKRCSTSQAVVEMQIKRTMDAIFLPSDLKKILNIDDIQCHQGGGQSSSFDSVGGSVSCCNLLGQSSAVSIKL